MANDFFFDTCVHHLWKECEFDRPSDYTRKKIEHVFFFKEYIHHIRFGRNLFTYARVELFHF